MNRLLVDVNAFAISLVEDHPGFDHISSIIDDGLGGTYEVLIHDYTPLRAQYILTSEWNVPHVPARNAVQSALRQPFQLCPLDRDSNLDAYEISATKNHGVYDSIYVSLARELNVDAILTTDTGFKTLCNDETFDYLNPVPDDVLERFYTING
jgi:predicted nucleic acid-binding protein